MSLKVQRQREKLKKKVKRGFRGYPVASLAYYGPTDERASKVVVGVVAYDGAKPDPLEKWFSEATDVRNDPELVEAVLDFLTRHEVKSVVGVDRIIGCPHEEGTDYPKGEWCSECPFWMSRDRFTGKVLQ